MSYFKKCFVPECSNSWSTTPNKVFFFIRDSLKRRWCEQFNIAYSTKNCYCCEDHLNLTEDLENYHYWKYMKGRPNIKSTAKLKYTTLGTSSLSQESTALGPSDQPMPVDQEPSELQKLLTSKFDYKDTKTKRKYVNDLELVSGETKDTTPINGNSASNANGATEEAVGIADDRSDDNDGCDDRGDMPQLPGPKYSCRCKVCGGDIMGFRYVCVQCADWDLCGACEAREAHAAHYVLRVPSPRPYEEIQAILAAIRHQLLSENHFLPGIDDSIKIEVKDEPKQFPELPMESDPLGYWDSALQEDIPTEDIPEENESDGDHPSPRKRPRPAPMLAHARENSRTSHESTPTPTPTPTDDTPTTSDHDSTLPLATQTQEDLSATTLANDDRGGRSDVNIQTPTHPNDNPVSTLPHHKQTLPHRTEHQPRADIICRNQTPLRVTAGDTLKTPKSKLGGKTRCILVKVPLDTDPVHWVQELRRKASVRLTRLPV